MSKRRRRARPDDHLPYPQDFHRPLDPQRRLEKFFLRTDGEPALEVLRKLDERFGIGGALPYLTIRAADAKRGPMIVVCNSENGDERSTEISAAGLTMAQAQLHPTARVKLDRYAQEKLLRLQSQYVPTTVRYATILRWWLETVEPKRLAKEKEAARRRNNRERGIRDPLDRFDAHFPYVTKLMEFFRDRRLSTHTEEVGDDFNKWLRAELVTDGAPLEGDHPVGGADGTVAQYQYRLACALKELTRRFRPPIRLGFRRTYPRKNVEQRLATGFTWPEVLRIIVYCLGYVWNEDGFAWEWVDEEGGRRRWLFVPNRKTHILYFFPVIRFVLIYFLTGTRFSRIGSLGYKKDDYRGWIDLARRMIIRNGRLSPDYPNKPRRPSRILPAALRIFRWWHAQDRRQQVREQWHDVDKGGYYVVHDGRGGEVTNIRYRAKKAFAAVGITHTNHDLKTACVGVFWEAGFDLRRIARLIGNDPDTVEEDYLFLVAESEGVLRPSPDWSKLTFLNFVDPQRKCRRIPRASRPGPPPEPAGG
ncbi:hypothetical protein XH79_41710 [Bradyrhizobium sp. CCBAU 45389]|nr:hypothetical protein [Bradyrhizobium sp. CCBAU 45389]